MDGALTRACGDCDSVHFVVEGSGFRHTIMRAILAANIFAGGRRCKVFVASSAAEAVRVATTDTRKELAAAMTSAGARGLVKAMTVTVRPPPEGPG